MVVVGHFCCCCCLPCCFAPFWQRLEGRWHLPGRGTGSVHRPPAPTCPRSPAVMLRWSAVPNPGVGGGEYGQRVRDVPPDPQHGGESSLTYISPRRLQLRGKAAPSPKGRGIRRGIFERCCRKFPSSQRSRSEGDGCRTSAINSSLRVSCRQTALMFQQQSRRRSEAVRREGGSPVRSCEA